MPLKAHKNRPDNQKPWLRTEAWKTGRIYFSNLPQAIFHTVFTIGFNLIIWIIVIATSSRPIYQENRYKILVLLAFLAAFAGCLAMIFHALLFWRRVFKYGDAIFQMTHVPGNIGGSLAGVITMTPRERLCHDLQLSLSCNRAFNDTEETLWRDACSAPIPDTPGELRFPVFFRIPAECESSRESEIIWRLELKEHSNDEDPIAAFVVPVFY